MQKMQFIIAKMQLGNSFHVKSPNATSTRQLLHCYVGDKLATTNYTGRINAAHKQASEELWKQTCHYLRQLKVQCMNAQVHVQLCVVGYYGPVLSTQNGP